IAPIDRSKGCADRPETTQSPDAGRSRQSGALHPVASALTELTTGLTPDRDPRNTQRIKIGVQGTRPLVGVQRAKPFARSRAEPARGSGREPLIKPGSRGRAPRREEACPPASLDPRAEPSRGSGAEPLIKLGSRGRVPWRECRGRSPLLGPGQSP